ncbi:glycosyltransferase [Muricoccus radiodurans]|uniref:glycosyltransferase n=1 Tax=Muricoccus radiodurans TaxID=2231721 RepID=UPI003CEE9017
MRRTLPAPHARGEARSGGFPPDAVVARLRYGFPPGHRDRSAGAPGAAPASTAWSPRNGTEHGVSGGRDEEVRALRRAGDAARDARRWAEAAAAYGEYLARRPDDRGILVQRGHALKESGDPEAALALYHQAAAMAPGDADIHVQIGHALKLLGRLAEALDAYGKGVVADPGARHAWEEWRALSARAAIPRRPAGTLLDLSDLLSWHGTHRTPSGIQRVQSEIAAAALAGAAPVTLCAMPPGGRGWRALPVAAFLRLRHLSHAPAGDDADWQHTLGAIGAWLDRAPDLVFAPGDLLVTPGSAWWLPEYPVALRAARAAGLRHVPVLHDCGPLVLPDTDPAARRDFARWFETLPVLADGVIAVSQATAADFRRLMARHLPDAPVPPVAVVTPDGWTEPPAAPAPLPAAEAPGVLGGALGALGLRRPAAVTAAHPDLAPGEPFVLFVGSLEPRKNHALAFAAWQRLIARRGAAATPRLVLAGRRVEGDEAAMAVLEEDPALAGRVTLLPGLDDAAVGRLYAACLFTVYPSRHEGWGLPVSESLGHGKVAVVPEASALVESGRNGAVFFVAGSAEDLATTVESLLPEAARVAAEARIPPRGGLRDWSAVAADLLAAARRLTGPEHEAGAPLLPLLAEIPLARGTTPDPRPEAVLAAALPEGAGWGPPAPDGLWSRRGPAALRFRVEEHGPLRLRLSVTVPLGARPHLALRRAGAEEVLAECLTPGPAELALEIGQGGPELELTLDGPLGRLADGREAGLGLHAIGLMRGHSLAERIAYLEARTLVPLIPEG